MGNHRIGVRSLLRHSLRISIVVASCGISTQSFGGELTHFEAVRAKYGLRGIGQSVAVIDSGIAYDHVALGGGLGPGYRVVAGQDFTEENDSNPYDDPGPGGGHGTGTSSIIGADFGQESFGVAPAADLVGLRVFNDSGAGYFDWLESALQWVHANRNTLDKPITTVNLSLESRWNSDAVPTWTTIEDELALLEADGIFIAAMAGNGFSEFETAGLAYPAASPHVVPVMSINDDGQLSFFSQRHQRAIATHGRDVLTAVPDYMGDHNGIADDFAPASGTDFAAPFLAGASVVIREAFEFAGSPSVTQQDIYEHMISTSDSLFDPATNANYRVLNLAAAVDALMPADDFGSSPQTATDLGIVGGSRALAGLVGTIADVDYFSFMADRSGTARLVTSASHYLLPEWTILDSAGVEVMGDQDFSFPVVADERYTLAIATADAIGYYDSVLTILDEQPIKVGDYNRNGVVDAADYTVWRDTLGSTTNLLADGNANGMIDVGDYNVWKQQMNTNVSPAVAEPSGFALFLTIAFISWGSVRRRRKIDCKQKNCALTWFHARAGART